MRENRSMPRSAVIPVIARRDVEAAAAWLCGTFGFRLRLRIGAHRAQLSHGAGDLVISQGEPAAAGFSILVRVEDARAHHDQAKAKGAEILGPPADQPYGERQYSARDPWGGTWTFSETIADVAPESWGGEVA